MSINFSEPIFLNCSGDSAASLYSFSFFDGMGNHISPVSENVETAVIHTAKSGIRTKNKP
jgi:hypothetical protein